MVRSRAWKRKLTEDEMVARRDAGQVWEQIALDAGVPAHHVRAIYARRKAEIAALAKVTQDTLGDNTALKDCWHLVSMRSWNVIKVIGESFMARATVKDLRDKSDIELLLLPGAGLGSVGEIRDGFGRSAPAAKSLQTISKAIYLSERV